MATRDSAYTLLFTAAVAATLAMPRDARAQAVVRTVLVGSQSVTRTDRIHLSRFADLTEQPDIAVGTPLHVGDLFWTTGAAADVLLEIACPAGTKNVFRFSGGFRAVVLPSRADVACVVQLLGGGVDVRAEEPTEVNAGGIVLGSKGTQYAVRLRRSGESALCEGAVYDDALRVQAPTRELELAESTSWVFDFGTREGRRGAIAPEMIKQTAEIAARFDVAQFVRQRLPGATPLTAQELQRTAQELFDLHLAALSAPSNPEPRVKLGMTQQKLGIVDSAQYNLKRAERIRSVQPPGSGAAAKATQPTGAPGAGAVTETTPRPTQRPAPLEVAGTKQPARSAERTAGSPTTTPAARGLDLVRAGRAREAIEVLEPVVNAGRGTARDYYALAEAYRATQNRAAARKAAEQALAAPDAGSTLASVEIEILRAIIREG